MGLPQLAFASRGPAHPTSPSNGSITICRSPKLKGKGAAMSQEFDIEGKREKKDK